MEKSDLQIYKEGLEERLKNFFKEEGFEETKISITLNSNDSYGNRTVIMKIKAVNSPYANKNQKAD